MRSYTKKFVAGSVSAAIIVGLSACGSSKDEQQTANPGQSSARADVTATSTQSSSPTVTAVATGTATPDDAAHERGEVKEASPVVKKVVPVLPARKVKLPARKAPKVPATKPVGTLKPVVPNKPTSPNVPGESAKPVEAPTSGETPAPQQPKPSEKPTEPTAPVKTSLPEEPTTGPAVPTTPAQPEQPVSPDRARVDAVFAALEKTTASTTSLQMEFTDHLDKSGEVMTTDLFLDPSRERGTIVYPDGGLLEFINIDDRAYVRGNRAYWKRELGKEFSEEFYAEVDGKYLLTTRGAAEAMLADHLAGFQGSSNEEMRAFFDTVTVTTYAGKPAWKLTGTGDPRLQLTVSADAAHELLEFHGPSEPGAKDQLTMKYRMRNAIPAISAPASDLVLDVRG